MRIRLNDTTTYNNYNSNETPCGTSTYGEVEDYTVNLEFIIGTWYYYAGAANTDTAFEYITNVNFGEINNSSGLTGYGNYVSKTATITKTETKTATVTIANPNPSDKLYAWIDWNKDGDFNDTCEQVCNKNANTNTITFDVTPPSPFPPFYYPSCQEDIVMRIRLNNTDTNGIYFNVSNETPNGESIFGEVEDYSIHILPASSINNISNNTFTIYPNPNNGVFNIVTTNNASNKITITDISGKLVYENNTNTNNILVDLNNVNKGIYFVKIFNEAGVKTNKILIK